MSVGIDMGQTSSGLPATLDLEELLATRLLVQGNSGSGKSHLLRRLVEQSVPWVQQAVIDPEGDFVTLAEVFGHLVVDAAAHTEAALQQIGGRVRQHRVSVVLNLENLDTEMQMRHCAAFLGGLFDADREFWFPLLVVVDEAQLFAPAAAGEVSDEARKASLGAMTNLMCRGRKRGLAGVIATQRLAKLAKNVAAEASNFLMGRTFLDIDMARAADLLGMERRQAEMFRDLLRGHFIALGPALSRRPLAIRIGAAETGGRTGSPKLLPLPEPPSAEDAREMIFRGAETPRQSARRIVPPSTAELLQRLAAAPPPPLPPLQPAGGDCSEGEPDAEGEAEEPPAAVPAAGGNRRGAVFDAVLNQLLADPEALFRPEAVLFQDFLVRCRSHGVNGRTLEMAAFRRKLAAARSGTADRDDDNPEWNRAVAVAAGLAEDLQGVYLLLARHALAGMPCPPDSLIARARGSRSPRRARSLLAYMEQSGLIVLRESLDGCRVIGLPDLERETTPGDPTAPEEG